jgi:hypothetical protein
MKISIWNLRWAGRKGMSVCLSDLISDYALDFIGLQETMKKKIINKVFSGILILVVVSFGNGSLLLVSLGEFYVVPGVILWRFRLLSWAIL